MRKFLLKGLILVMCLMNLNIMAQYVNLIADIDTGPNDSYPRGLAMFNNKLYFGADDGINGFELWVYDGVNAPTMIADINAGSNDSYPSGFTGFNNKLYFRADDGVNGYELWVYDGVNAPTMFADINAGTNSSAPYNFTEFNNKLYFSADDGITGTELWVYDGVNTPTMIADINTIGYLGSSPSEFIEFNGQLYFRATNGTSGSELWVYDGVNAPTMFADINAGTNSSAPYNFTEFNGQLYFSADDGINEAELWTYDGVNAPTMIADINIYGYSILPSSYGFEVFNGQLYFSADDGINGEELWTYDGINTPTMVANISNLSSSPAFLTEFNGQLYFRSSNGFDGPELWTYDGINTPTMVDDLNVGSYYGVGSSPSFLTVFNNQLCFAANDGILGSELWALTLPVETGIDTHVVCDSLRWIDNTLYTMPSNTAATYFISGGATNGNDSLVILDLTILNSSIKIDTQSAPSPFTWIDGNTYTTDNNTATDTLVNAAGCDSVVTLNLTIIDTIIQGTITNSFGSGLQNSKVYLIQYFANTDTVFAMDSTFTDALGFYEFPNTFQNAYVKAVPDISNYPNEIPTYNVSSAVFQNADAVYLSYPFGNTDFATIAGVNQGGNGFISGIVGNGAGKNSEVGELLPNISLLLMNANDEVVAQTLTDINGHFEFDNIAEETYSLWVDKAGVLNNLAPSISLAADNNQDNLQFILHKTYLENVTSVGIKNISQSHFNIFPNPTNQVLTIQNLEITEKYTVELYSVLGEQVFQVGKDANQKKTLNIDLEKLNLSKGTYFVKIATEQGNFVSKVVYR